MLNWHHSVCLVLVLLLVSWSFLQIMALHGNKPIRLSYSTNRVQNSGNNGQRRVVNGNGNRYSQNTRLSIIRRRKLRILKQRRLEKERERLRSTLPPTTTTIPTTPETTTSWYDSYPIDEEQSSTPGGFTDSILDYNYEYKIDDY